ncbi:right-handed parallel beta-helix repeat-containing protein [Dyella nitratireducens]|uniref:Pectate lyase superfamily protein domain-containing protein n=1 Tax=Dyella nitratireducens TaxID=1849580 RepID=A0ABQ1GFT4_9GAMM|nr:right-handed parallel beta-helix repeat-containing protein [Dyella nitratireducens]GGA42789.1 hypothetical protein GCM10010981_34870 [Dyella nitratireducens]GLQ41956.1 hypothetical protein GCM10007902_18060 [Dyella nitratireducens]
MISHSQLNPIPISDLGSDVRGGILAPVVNVRDMGAKGDGRTDDTDAFQAAVDEVPETGGSVIVPRGDYRIDATKSIVLHSNMLLMMDPAATLAAIPNKVPKYRVIKVWNISNVRIVGGRLVGERRLHVTESNTPIGGDEQGFGIEMLNAHNVIVSDMHVSDFWGDGIWIGAHAGWDDGTGGPLDDVRPSTNVLINRVHCSYNRRQGLSVGPADNVTIMNSTFSFTGPTATEGTRPMAGIDLEPQRQGLLRNVSISHCIFMRNRGCGMEIHGNVIGVSIDNCLFSDNFGYGIITHEEEDMEEKELTGLSFTNNTVSRNGLVGALFTGETDCLLLANNTFVNNGFLYQDGDYDGDREWITGQDIVTDTKSGMGTMNWDVDPEKSTEPDLVVVRSTTNVRLRGNTYTRTSDPDDEFGDRPDKWDRP